MNISRFHDKNPADNPHGVDVRRLYESPHALVSHLTLRPGERLLRHVTPVDVFFYVLEGTGTVEVGEEKLEVSRDTLVDSPRDIPHCWYNDGDGVLRVLIVKVPRPASGTKIL